jgi:hypothetical protein
MIKFAFFVDGSNLFGSLKGMNIEVDDYQAFFNYLYKAAEQQGAPRSTRARGPIPYCSAFTGIRLDLLTTGISMMNKPKPTCGSASTITSRSRLGIWPLPGRFSQGKAKTQLHERLGRCVLTSFGHGRN